MKLFFLVASLCSAYDCWCVNNLTDMTLFITSRHIFWTTKYNTIIINNNNILYYIRVEMHRHGIEKKSSQFDTKHTVSWMLLFFCFLIAWLWLLFFVLFVLSIRIRGLCIFCDCCWRTYEPRQTVTNHYHNN